MRDLIPADNYDIKSLLQDFNRRDMNLNLERMRKALKAMKEPCKTIPAIQIAGTNGKGSIASFLQSSLITLGIRSGVTTSPHLINWCERITSNGKQISLNEFEKRIISLKQITEKFQLTPFEVVIATALDHFRDKNVELLVLEVGLGGRLDATTAHPYRPIIAMAGIGLDHCEHLGDSLEKIAEEKSAVISSNSTVISAPQHPKVEQVLHAVANKNNAKLNFVKPLTEEWDLGLPGLIQRNNAAVAKGALEALQAYGWTINKEKVREGLARAEWPGRLQKALWEGMPILLDCAHNPHAAEQLAIERLGWAGQEYGVNWILAIQRHKDAPSMVNSLLKSSDSAWIVSIPGKESWTKEELILKCPDKLRQLNSAIDVEMALSEITENQSWSKPSPVITGSIYVIGALIEKKIISLESN